MRVSTIAFSMLAAASAISAVAVEPRDFDSSFHSVLSEAESTASSWSSAHSSDISSAHSRATSFRSSRSVSKASKSADSAAAAATATPTITETGSGNGTGTSATALEASTAATGSVARGVAARPTGGAAAGAGLFLGIAGAVALL